ncbi:unnamed protein product [Cuscuta campestris]|uniref:Integrase catalytic domain-containing protein n=1 Tax=Cuscuta campestris TaxID=132261 RepID=A0A484MQ92_9ASTE|nr:unnamed protein product [Cuscuta campestris]
MAGRRTRRNTAASAQSTVRSDQPEQGMVVLVNGLETALNNVANMMANIIERLDQALPGPSGTRNVPAGQPRQVLHTASTPILQELHDPEEVERERQAIARLQAEELARNNRANGDRTRAMSQIIGNGNGNPRGTIFERISHQRAHQTGQGGSQAPTRPLVVLDEEEVQSQARVPAARSLGPQVPEAGEFQDLRQQIQEMQRKINRGRVFTTQTNTPLAPEIFAEPYPQGFKVPFVKRYDGESDPQEHINSYVQVNHIPAGSIRTWDELGLRFLEHFAGNCRPKKHFTHLASVRQKHGESLKNFLVRWRKESREVEGTDDKSRLAMFTAALQDGLLHTDLTTHPPDTFEEAMVRAGRYVTLEERKEEKKEKTPKEEEKVGNKKPFKNKKQGFPDGPKGTNPGTSEKQKSANPMFTLPVAEKRHHGCNYIIGGNLGGDSATSRKKWASAAMVNKVAAPAQPEGKKLETEPIVFSNADLSETGVPHRDALVITIDIMDLLIHKTLVDTGSSVSIMYMDTYKALGLTRDELLPIKTPLTGFTDDSIEPEGVITLPVEVGDTKATRKLDMEFVVVGIISNTNVILGRPGLEDLECVISPRHLCIKFPTPHGIGVARGSQRVSRAWYLKATKQPIRYDTQVGEVTAQLLRVEERRPRVEVAGDVEEVELEPGMPGRLVRMGKGLGAELRSRVISVLRRFRKVFAWSPADMPGLDHKIVVHRLNILQDAKPVKQKRRHLSQGRRDFVKKEVTTLQSIGHIQETLADFHVECTAREMTRARVGTRVEDDWWVMSIEGSSGSRSFGAGIVLITPESFRIYYAIRFQFRLSNNESEYEALINGPKILGKLGVSRVQVYSDSRLVMGQISGEFEAKEKRMKRYRDLSLEMLGRFEYKLEHIPRAYNAEELATPSLNRDEVLWVSTDPPEWLARLVRYIEDGVASEDPQEARLLRMRAHTYKVQEGILYKRSYDGVLLRCLRAAEAEALMEEIHEGVCAAHQGPYSISRRAIIQGYFWPTMRKDCEEYVRKCPTCQQFQNIPERPVTNYTPISSVIPFSRWGIDIVGALPKGIGHARWIVVAIDYFTKWVEGEPLAGITGKQMIDFVGTNILCRFGVPKQIISDNGTQFEEAEFQDFLKT